MAKYLVIEFDDDAQADALCAQINTATRAGKKFRIAGIFQRPSRFCICPRDRNNYRTKDQVVRGGRLGWWVCVACKRPRLGDHHPYNQVPSADIIDPHGVEGIDWFAVKPEQKPYTFMVTLGVHPFPLRQKLPGV